MNQLFNITTAKSTDKNKIKFTEKGAFEFIGRSSANNGVQGRVDLLPYPPNPEKSFSLVQVGESVCLYRNNQWYASQNIFTLIPLDPRLAEYHLFVISSINRALKIYSNAYTYPTLEDVKGLLIQMPILPNGTIDFGFIAEFVAELEANRVAELDAYLTITGLKNYTLTAAEQLLINNYDSLEFRDFKITNIFNIKNSGNILSRDIVENSGTTPYLCASAENNAVNTYISYKEQLLDKGNCVFIGGKTFVVTYQEKDFYSNDSHNLILRLIDKTQRSRENQLCFATCINKSLNHKYSWGDSISSKKIQEDFVRLPSKNKEINYDAIKTLIVAVSKLVIKDVVEYADKKLAALKK